ncbi:MAG TPA: 3-deoxy-manno-octulosonate cytidylyltransferase [Salinivirgaceae bacterium]|nr:3-deoxy-manno-octulosonate cytidylyltransferase [Salinivirgaceae bacterium]HQA76028.1 3-deoxy-manno-octulosonate cytidylyltransferase [Salinivirgaceae bacterium]
MADKTINFAALIPARYASSRFPGKPLVNIHGKPMIQHVYERASEVFKRCAVATDDKRIADAVKAFGGMFIMTASHHQSGTDRCAEASETAIKEFGWEIDVVVNIQGDEPFMQAEQLRQICACFDNENTQIATLIKKIDTEIELFDINKPKVVIDTNGRAIYFSRNPIPFMRGKPNDQWLNSHVYYKHIGMYAYRLNILHEISKLKRGKLEVAESLEQLRWLENGFKIQTSLTDIENLSVDTPEDLTQLLLKGNL